MRWPKPVSVVVALALLVPAAALALYASGNLPYRVYVVHTGSMRPTIPPESAVIVREHRYRVGQVISFTEHGTVVSHRLMAIAPDGRITTKGDANRTVDPWHVPVSNVIGGVVAAPRHLGYLLVYLKTLPGGASVLIALLCLWQIWALAGGFAGDESGEVALNAGVPRWTAGRAREVATSTWFWIAPHTR